MNDPVKAHQVMARGFPWIPVIAAGAVLVGAFIWAAVQFGFFVDTANQVHQNKVGAIQASGQASIAQNSWSYNSGVNDALNAAWQQMHSDQEALAQEPSYAQADTKAAVLSDGQQVCAKLSELRQNIVPASTSIVSWAKINCDGTDVAMTSSLRK